MQIMFGKVPEDDFEDDNFIVSEKEQYYYCMDINSESFSIADSCDRTVYLSLNDIAALKQAITILEIKAKPILASRDAEDELDSDKVYVI
jgi:hypothetical protein